MNIRPTNPYIAGSPILNAAQFFGREELIRSIEAELLNPSVKVIVLFGQRRIGKTSIQLQLRQSLAAPPLVPVFFDLQGWSERPLGELLFELASSTLRCIGATLDIGTANDYDDAGNFFQRVLIPRLQSVIGSDRRAVFLFDEFDTFEAAAEAGRNTNRSSGRALFNFISNLISQDNQLAFVFVVGRHAEDLSKNYQAIFKGSHVKEIWVLDDRSSEQLILQAQANNSLQFTGKSVIRISMLTGGHPYMTQLLCQRIWELAHRGRTNVIPLIDEKDVDSAVGDALMVGEGAFVWLWEGLSIEERIFAAAFAAGSESFQELSKQQVLKIIRDNSGRLRIPEIEQSHEKLVKRHILKRTSEQGFRFEIEVFRQWIKQNRPLYQVKESLDQLIPEAEAMYQTSKQLVEKGELEQAIGVLQQALSLNPNHFRSQFMLSECYLTLNQIQRAILAVERAFQIDPDQARDVYVRVLLEASHAAFREKAFSRAIKLGKRVQEIEQDNRTATELISDAQRLRGRALLRLVGASSFLLMLNLLLLPFLRVVDVRNSQFISFAIIMLIALLFSTLVGGAFGLIFSMLSGRQEASFLVLLSRLYYFPGYRTRYLTHLRYRCGSYDVKGLLTQGIYTLSSDMVYVQLDVEMESTQPGNVAPIISPQEVLIGAHSVWEFLTSPPLHQRNFIIIGSPGSGKTSLLKHMALTLATGSRQSRSVGASHNLPILLNLRDLAPSIKTQSDCSLPRLLYDSMERWHIDVPQVWYRDQLLGGNCLIMFDGLDEVFDLEERKLICNWLEECMAAFPKNRFIITSRPAAYRDTPLVNVAILKLLPYNQKQIASFVNRWFLANEIQSVREDNPSVRALAEKRAEDLLNQISVFPALQELAANPLLLLMIAQVHTYRSSLPSRRVELYHEICEVALGKRQMARGLIPDLVPAKSRAVLGTLAFKMMLEAKRDISLAEATTVLASQLSSIGTPDISPHEFLNMIVDRSGLLQEIGNEVYRFAHLAILEYLASVHVMREDREQVLIQHINDNWWHETIRLYCAQSDASRVITACLDEFSVSSLRLATECMAETLSVHPDVRARFQDFVENAKHDPDPERRRVWEEAVLSLSLPSTREATSAD